MQHNNLFIEYEFPGDWNDNLKKQAIGNRYRFITMRDKENTPVCSYALQYRTMQSDATRSRAVYSILAFDIVAFQNAVKSGSNGVTGCRGRDTFVGSSQPTARLLQDSQSPSTHNDNELTITLDGDNLDPSRRLLAFSDSSINAKTHSISTFYIGLDPNSPIKYLFVFHLFAVVYWFVTIYLIFIHPFFESTRKSVRCFWIGHYAFYF